MVRRHIRPAALSFDDDAPIGRTVFRAAEREVCPKSSSCIHLEPVEATAWSGPDRFSTESD